MDQFKHTFDILVIDTGKCLIQCNNSGVIFIIRLFILCVYCSEQRHIHCHCFFTSTEPVKRSIGQWLLRLIPAPVKHLEFKPFPVIQSISYQLHVINDRARLFQLCLFCTDLAAEMTCYLFNIIQGKQLSVAQKDLLQIRRIQFFVIVSFAGLPFQGKTKAHRGIDLLHKLRHVFCPFSALCYAVRKLLADRLGQDIFEKLPVLFLYQQFCLFDSGLQDIVKFLQIYFLAIPDR